MIVIPNIFNRILLDIETKFLSGLSFLLVSLVSFHFIFYINFYNFSDDWVRKESSRVTLQILPDNNEKRIPKKIKQQLKDFLQTQENILSTEFFDDLKIKNDLGLEDLNSFSNIRIPLVIQLSLKNIENTKDFENIKEVSGSRKFKVHFHKVDLFEINNLIYRVKVFIFIFGTVISLLFGFLLTFLLKNTLEKNLRFFETIQIMGAESWKIAINLSFIMIKKILPGSLLAILVTTLISNTIIRLFNLNYIVSNTFFLSEYLSSVLLLSFFLFIVSLFLITYLLIYIFFFLEKRLFVKP